MEKLANQVIDFYDDTEGTVLKSRFPSPETLPNIIKEGSLMDEAERSRMRDDLFALVMRDGDAQMRKFACTDGCNTALSVIYLLDHAKDLLPDAAVKTAAQNLTRACDMYNIEAPPSLAKLAGAMPDEITPYVDVTGYEIDTSEPPVRHCLVKEAQYPIDSYEQILKANSFFAKHGSKLHPAKRREFCLNLTKRASELGTPTAEAVQKYAANGWQAPLQVKEQIQKRMEKVGTQEARDYYRVLFTKIGSVDPGVFANMLMEIDEATGLDEHWDNGISDPFTATLRKEAASFSYTAVQGTVDEEDLMQLKGYRTLLSKAFGEDFADEFKKNPVAVFKSLPEPEKNTIVKLVAAARKW